MKVIRGLLVLMKGKMSGSLFGFDGSTISSFVNVFTSVMSDDETNIGT